VSNLIVDVENSIARIVINRPESGNRLEMSMVKEMTQLINDFSFNMDIKVIHLTGQGDDFSQGRQLHKPEPSNIPLKKSANQIRAEVTDPLLAVYAAMKSCQIPLVSSVFGNAFGLGCAIATLCDITLASSKARFSLPEMKSNLPPTLAISAVMHVVPRKALAHLVYSTDEIDAQQAFEYGFVSKILPIENFSELVNDYIAKLVTRDRAALSAVKEYLNLAPGKDFDIAARYASNLLSGVLASQ
jgi:enoyl-CoA hydratase/carnithine racemase